jgi:uncharacterized protein (TIGR00303 family)
LLSEISSTAGSRAVSNFAAKNPVFVCVISYTATSEIPGLTVAGANPELVKYTSPADAEFLYHGRCVCIDKVPATPDGKPTPALITRTALLEGKMPAIVVDAGAKIKPSIPFVSFGLGAGENIAMRPALRKDDAARALKYGEVLGSQLGRLSDLVVVGESIPGGTTTALAVLTALGFEARFRLSSSMPDNPHDLKNRIVKKAMERNNVGAGKVRSAMDAVTMFGDPMIPSVAGIAKGALHGGSKVMLAGGTQMTAVLALLKMLGVGHDGLCIGTTSYVLEDKTSDLRGLAKEIWHKVPVLGCDLHLAESTKPGLRAFSEGFVKEGVGAGGSSIAAMLKFKTLSGKKLMRSVERQYEFSIESGR